MIKLTEIYHLGGDAMYNNWSLRETEINPLHVVKITGDSQMDLYLHRGYLPKDLNEAQTFTRISFVTGPNIIVVGSLNYISEKLNKNSKQLLNG